ncbi:nucleoside deaminase [Piscibacillus sp. B03]|uniref:nucleoside deaminase n=1 Tax=Piscibacillus sp. B03 TaxID=3457430 RepID=UPI003FCCF9C8
MEIYQLDHQFFMGEAIKEAEKAGLRGDRPIGAVIVHKGEIVARGSNHIETDNHNTAHAEINAINEIPGYLRKHARECLIYSTVEPCVMCLPTIVMANIRHIVFSVKDHYMDTESLIKSSDYLNKRVHSYVGGVLEEDSLRVIKKYHPRTAKIITGELV